MQTRYLSTRRRATNLLQTAGLRVYATCPPSYSAEPGKYAAQVDRVAKWAETAGCEGMLIYTDNRAADPWMVAQRVISATERLVPLVAVQPLYMHPFAAATMISTIGLLYGRRIALNMVAGGFAHDLESLGDTLDHDRRYDRLGEYTELVLRLLAEEGPVSYSGEFYKITNATLSPRLPPDLSPRVFVSGSSKAGESMARKVGAIAVRYPERAATYAAVARDDTHPHGLRLGIVARTDSHDAWRAARERFPETRKGQLTHQLAMKTSDSEWHAQLAAMAAESAGDPDDPYWMTPFENYHTFCPYLVGDYDRVAAEIQRYIAAGYRVFIIDVPASAEELAHIGLVFERAAEMVLA